MSDATRIRTNVSAFVVAVITSFATLLGAGAGVVATLIASERQVEVQLEAERRRVEASDAEERRRSRAVAYRQFVAVSRDYWKVYLAVRRDESRCKVHDVSAKIRYCVVADARILGPLYDKWVTARDEVTIYGTSAANTAATQVEQLMPTQLLHTTVTPTSPHYVVLGSDLGRRDEDLRKAVKDFDDAVGRFERVMCAEVAPADAPCHA